MYAVRTLINIRFCHVFPRKTSHPRDIIISLKHWFWLFEHAIIPKIINCIIGLIFCLFTESHYMTICNNGEVRP